MTSTARPGDLSPTLSALLGRITDRRATVGVVGLGYVGLPLAVELARAGFVVTGIDRDPGRAGGVARGESHVGDVPGEELAALVRAGRLAARTAWGAGPGPDVVLVAVPTPTTRHREPDLSAVREAAAELAPGVRPGQLVVLESTTYPGTTEEVLLPAVTAGGLRAGHDVAVAYSPERVDPGSPGHGIAATPKLVGGVTAACTTLARTFYETAVTKVIPVSSPRVAEMAKLLENTFRNVNIALVNELAMLCDRMGLDVWEVVEAAGTKPFGFMPFTPGPGVGGHCLPVDPVYLAWKAREYDFYPTLITRAAEVNAGMPYFVAQKLLRLVARQGGPVLGSRVLLLGVTFKRNVADVRNSPALKLLDLLRAEGLEVAYHDPLAPELVLDGGQRLESVALTAAAVAGADCVVIHTDHAAIDYEWVVAHARLVLDTRHATRHVRAGRDKVVRL
jgi:UDP-N-acetyl-D-glucosamine dehydrogenase